MTTETVITFTALLALAAGALALVVAVTFVLSRLAPANVRVVCVRFMDWLAPQALAVAALVAVVMIAGSLYFSEYAKFVPCKLCWFQRICAYPLAIILPVAVFRKDKKVAWYALPLASIGLCISSWHYLIQRVPSLEAAGSCDIANPCTAAEYMRWGFVSLPFQALLGFATVVVLVLLALRRPCSPKTSNADATALPTTSPTALVPYAEDLCDDDLDEQIAAHADTKPAA